MTRFISPFLQMKQPRPRVGRQEPGCRAPECQSVLLAGTLQVLGQEVRSLGTDRKQLDSAYSLKME